MVVPKEPLRRRSREGPTEGGRPASRPRGSSWRSALNYHRTWWAWPNLGRPWMGETLEKG